jgi:hypothetical protein
MLGTVPNDVSLRGLRLAPGYILGHPYAALDIYSQQGSAVSLEAVSVGHAASMQVRAAESSVALFGGLTAAISRLRELADDCAHEDWDGAGAIALEPAAVANAERFLRALPVGIPMPECSPEPDGSVSLDWAESRYRLFSVSMSSSNRLAFAWLDGSDKGHGVCRFDGMAVPERVLLGLRLILPEADAPVRAA